ncbi:MAG: hypothetical protein ACFFC7_12560 [Candidatus Hermodarchaeota archaeon]
MRTEGTSKRPKASDSKEGSIVIRTKIDGESASQFLEIQKQGNFVTYAETLRHLISKTYNGTNLRLHPDLIKEIQQVIQNKSILVKYAFIDAEDFMNRAIAFYLQKIKDEKDTLDNWELRAKLPEEYRQVALALLKIQIEQGQLSGATLDDLLEECQLPRERVERVLQYFTEQDLVVVTPFQDQLYYTAILPTS